MLTIYISLVAALLLASPLPAAAQFQYPECSSLSWSFNSLGQNPCAVAAYLQAVCDHGALSIPPLSHGYYYIMGTNSNGADDSSDLCKCNTVVYSLISACAACQDAVVIPWKKWSVNCSAVDPPSTFSNTIPSGTRVPAWAFLDVTKNGTWDPDLSYQAKDKPEVAASQSSFLPISTLTPETTQTSVPGLSSSQAPKTQTSVPKSSSQAQFTHDGHHINRTAAIVGGVLGGIVFIVLMVVLMLWRQRIKRRKATRAAAAVILGNRTVPLQEKVSKRNRDDPPPDVISSAI